jgi:hypothetical protein
VENIRIGSKVRCAFAYEKEYTQKFSWEPFGTSAKPWIVTQISSDKTRLCIAQEVFIRPWVDRSLIKLWKE